MTVQPIATSEEISLDFQEFLTFLYHESIWQSNKAYGPLLKNMFLNA